jgi:hypothetical protein
MASKDKPDADLGTAEPQNRAEQARATPGERQAPHHNR